MGSGLELSYCRAVALADDTLIVSASEGPAARRAALYRRPLDARGGEPFEQCGEGLPAWLTGNVDTGCVDARDGEVAFASPDGTVFASFDAGRTWRSVAEGVGKVLAVRIV